MKLVVAGDSLTSCADVLKKDSNTVGNIYNSVNSVKRSLNNKIWRSNGINNQITAVLAQLSSERESLSRMSNVLRDVNAEYAKMEIRVLGANGISTSVDEQTDNSSGKDSGTDKKDKDNVLATIFKKIIESFGFGGNFFNIFSTFTLDGSLSIDEGKLLLKLIGDGAKLCTKIGSDKFIREIFGLNSTIDAIGFRENLAIALEKYKLNSTYNIKNLTEGQKNANFIGAAAKWAGVALTGLERFVSNVDEFNHDFSNPRMYIETGLETAISVGEGILAGAAVSAILGATAPAWLAAAGGALVVFGIDSACKWVTGGTGFVELVSDGIIDLGENAINFAKDIGSGIVSGVSDFGKKLGDGVSQAGKVITKWFK